MLIPGHCHRLGRSDRSDRRVNASAGDDGHVRHSNADAARGGARSDLVVHATDPGLPAIGRQREVAAQWTTPTSHWLAGHKQSVQGVRHDRSLLSVDFRSVGLLPVPRYGAPDR